MVECLDNVVFVYDDIGRGMGGVRIMVEDSNLNYIAPGTGSYSDKEGCCRLRIHREQLLSVATIFLGMYVKQYRFFVKTLSLIMGIAVRCNEQCSQFQEI